ncbi:MAG: hypothetical protein INQ03_21975 [Candidatus Heimdallarchaeota archaeon]|nr:hypothetical protein [Candidatus Heimdallarchaeota archaeon]
MSMAWGIVSLSSMLLAISYLLLNFIIYKIAIISTVLILFALTGLVDTISRSRIQLSKIVVNTALTTALLIFSMEDDAVLENLSLLGERSPALNGHFALVSSLLFALASLYWIYYMVRIHLKIPSSLKFMSGINVLGAFLAGPVSALIFISGIIWYLPGLDYLLLSIGAIICTFAFSREPKLGYVLPFETYALIVFDRESGVPIYHYYWSDLINASFISGILKAISSILDESLNKGAVKSIRLDEAVVIINSIHSDRVAFALISSYRNTMINFALNEFAKDFTNKYREQLLRKIHKHSDYRDADKLIDKDFPFIITRTA